MAEEEFAEYQLWQEAAAARLRATPAVGSDQLAPVRSVPEKRPSLAAVEA